MNNIKGKIMKKYLFTLLPLFAVGTTKANFDPSLEIKSQACKAIDGYVIEQDTGRKGILGSMVPSGLIKNNNISYALSGENIKISNKKQYYCEFPKFNAEDCLYGTGSYAFWETPNFSSGLWVPRPTLLSSWEEDGVFNDSARSYIYKANSRGRKLITTVVTEKNFKVLIQRGIPGNAPRLPEAMDFNYPSLPFLSDHHDLNTMIWDGLVGWVEKQAPDGSVPDQYAHIPMCDAIEVMVQNKPTISKKSLNSFTRTNPIKASVNYSYDTSYSHAAINNKPVTFTWTFKNMDYSSIQDIVKSTSANISYSPRYSGEYKVTAMINDGTYSSSVVLGYVTYGGGSSCPPGRSGNCQNPF